MNDADFRPPGLKREIGWAFLLALGVQTAGAFLWAGAASARLTQLERSADATQQLLERTARLEEQGIAFRASLDRIEAKLDHLGTDDSKHASSE
jgi:hypothetical protein